MRNFLRAAGLIPVVVLKGAEQAVPTARALQAGGMDLVEVTFRSDAAAEAIRRIAAEVPDLLVGAGTVLDLPTAKVAIDAGARFVVAPAFNRAVVEYCQQQGVAVFPGVANPGQVEQALACGISEVKFFPASLLGGVAMIKAMAAVYPQVGFIPTGGINADNLVEYLRCYEVLACGGSWFVAPQLIAAGNYDKITQLSRQALQLSLDFSLAHVGINGSSEDDAQQIAGDFSRVLGLPISGGGSGMFVGTLLEVMKTVKFGSKGHIGFYVNRLEVARRLLQREGIKFHPQGEVLRDGRLVVAYLEQEIGGFALHLSQR